MKLKHLLATFLLILTTGLVPIRAVEFNIKHHDLFGLSENQAVAAHALAWKQDIRYKAICSSQLAQSLPTELARMISDFADTHPAEVLTRKEARDLMLGLLANRQNDSGVEWLLYYGGDPNQVYIPQFHIPLYLSHLQHESFVAKPEYFKGSIQSPMHTTEAHSYTSQCESKTCLLTGESPLLLTMVSNRNNLYTHPTASIKATFNSFRAHGATLDCFAFNCCMKHYSASGYAFLKATKQLPAASFRLIVNFTQQNCPPEVYRARGQRALATAVVMEEIEKVEILLNTGIVPDDYHIKIPQQTDTGRKITVLLLAAVTAASSITY